MTRAAVVQYHMTTVSTERNTQLIEDVLVELAARDPGGLHYQVFRFDDGVGFMQVAVFDGTTDPFAECSAYRNFHRELGDRLAAPPVTRGSGRIALRFGAQPALDHSSTT